MTLPNWRTFTIKDFKRKTYRFDYVPKSKNLQKINRGKNLAFKVSFFCFSVPYDWSFLMSSWLIPSQSFEVSSNLKNLISSTSVCFPASFLFLKSHIMMFNVFFDIRARARKTFFLGNLVEFEIFKLCWKFESLG